MLYPWRMTQRPRTETVEVDAETHKLLQFAAHIGRCSVGDIVARLVAETTMPIVAVREKTEHTEGGVAVCADYVGYRTHGNYDATTTRVDITSGPLAGRSFKTPTAAARAVVAHHNPGVSPNRNGWNFWRLDDGSGRALESVREPHDQGS
jgi:hypothetical protein